MLRLLMTLVVTSAVYGVTNGFFPGGDEAQAAAPAPVTATGQTSSYASFDDGALHPGVAWPVQRFTNNNNGTVTDNLTGLTWLKDANCTAISGTIDKSKGTPVGTLSWDKALTWSNALASGVCSLTDGSHAGDWRLPNARELESLVDISNIGPALPSAHPFSNVPAVNFSTYWSSSSFSIGGPNAAWYVDMLDGGVNHFSDKTNPGYVWPVRGGQSGLPVISVSPTKKSFDNITVGSTSAPQTFTISNSGKANLIVSAVSLAGGDPGLFTLTPGNGTTGSCGPTPTIAPAGNCTVSVSFTPTSIGAYAATLRIASNDPVNANMDVTLIGTGTTPPPPIPHTISTAVVGGNGSITCTTPVNTGGTSTCTIVPASNYHLADIVDNSLDLNNNVDKLAAVVNNQYTITNVTADHVVAGTFVHNAVLSAFSMPATTTSLKVPVTSFTASYASKYLITELSIAPDVDNFYWSDAVPTDYTFSAAGDMTAYAWVKDEAGNVSPSISVPVAFPSLQAAYDSAAAANVDVHLTTVGSMPANTGTAPEFVAGSGKTVAIKGGYDAANRMQGGVSLVTGSMKVKSGKVIAEGLGLRTP